MASRAAALAFLLALTVAMPPATSGSDDTVPPCVTVDTTPDSPDILLIVRIQVDASCEGDPVCSDPRCCNEEWSRACCPYAPRAECCQGEPSQECCAFDPASGACCPDCPPEPSPQPTATQGTLSTGNALVYKELGAPGPVRMCITIVVYHDGNAKVGYEPGSCHGASRM